ncbi:hypothetical protein BOX15_Mlig016931g2 [Macrostomum lignano]|uniref:non-specific serine/threonine protein kinase n=1 Tax=Macrostomum lignano TaxID=282301 RepID=A0A267DPQ8_9PLAT|nr:hypothetical protein BOX15_Mlig016931g2 [Macrostomum lignano]
MSERSSSAYLRIKLSGTSWTKEKEIGHGCFGKVFQGRLEDGTPIAAKQVKLEASSMDQMHSLAERVAKELAILESVTGSHKNIVRYYGFSISVRSKSIYFLMQHIEGPTLDSYVKSMAGAMSENEIRVITRQLLSALVFVHAKGIVHKDVKPDNVLIRSSDNVVKLIDFGIAGICGHKRDSIGPIAYSAPEITDESLPQSTKCDSFSLGLTVYFMATKSHPLMNDGAEALMLALMPMMLAIKMRSQEPLPDMDSSKFSSALCSFYKRSTHKHPSNRSSCSELLFKSEFMTGVRENTQDGQSCAIQ